MSMGVCLTDLTAKGAITAEQADRMRAVYDDLLAEFEPLMSKGAAEALATTRAMKAIEDDFLHARRQTLLQAHAQLTILHQARTVYDGGTTGPIDRRAMLAHLVSDQKARGIANVEYRWKNLKQTALGMMNDVLERHRANLLGQVRNKSDLNDMVRELWGESTGSVNARELADAWKQTSEWLRQMFNQAGGRIGKLEGWALPHRHDMQRVEMVSAEQWTDFVLPKLDRAKMIDRATGEPMSDARLRAMLADVHATIASDGWDGRAPGSGGTGAMANRYGEQRVLHFRSADEWMAYNDQFGAGSPYDAMIGHIETMSRDIASMQILGPNPDATVRWMGDVLTKEAATSAAPALARVKAREAARVGNNEISAVWNEVKGQNQRVVKRWLALTGSTLRNWQTSTKLGGAAITALSDHGTAAVTRAYNGIPLTQEFGRYLQQMNPADPETRAFARRRGVISDELIGRVSGIGRQHLEDAFGQRMGGGSSRLERAHEFSRRAADGVLRASGLNAHTIAMREAVAMEFWATAADNAGRSFDALDPRWRGFLERYGIDAEGWEGIRSAPMTDHRGAAFLTPDAIENEVLRNRFAEAILTETDFAVPTAGLYARSIVHVAPPGTIMGEAMRTGFQFKSFPITILTTHAMRAMAGADLGRKAGYAVGLMGATTLMGAVSFQLAEIAKGRNPSPMGEPDFWWKAAMKGGGAGILGDILDNARNEYGQSSADIAAGPGFGTFDTASQLADAVWASATADTNAEIEKAQRARGKAMRRLLAQEVPGSTIWYLRAAYERMLVDHVQAWADPQAARAFRDLERRHRDKGGYWAPPGAGLQGASAPDLTTAIGGRAQ
jgi:hypothetical protein